MVQDAYIYISTKTCADPVKTIFLCAPGEYAVSVGQAEEFAEKSGWKQQVEDDASVLIVPVVSDWSKADRDLIPKLYQKYKTKCKAPSGVSIPGRDGALWLWEVAIYLVGYQDGADFAGDTLVKHPNYFAASALVDGRAHDFTSADAPTVSFSGCR